MGRAVMRRPKHLNIFPDRHGKLRIYLKRPGCKQVPLRGPLGSQEFWEDYLAAEAGEPNRKPRRAAGAPGTFNRLVSEFCASQKFRSRKQSTQANYRGIYDAFIADYGDFPVAKMDRKHVKIIMNEKAATPGAANNWLKRMRALFNFAIDQDPPWRTDNPTIGVERYGGGEHHTWSDEEAEQYRINWALGTLQRTAFELAINTGQRCGDWRR